MGMDERRRNLHQRAAGQHGLVTIDDLRQAGFSDGARRSLYRNGEVERLGRQVCRLVGSVADDYQRVMAACLDLGGVASHRTACWLHGIGGHGPGDPPQVTIGRGPGDYRCALAEVHTTGWLPPYDIVRVDGIPCLGVARTLFTMAAEAPDHGLEPVRDCVDEAIRDGKATEAWLYWRLERLRRRGRPGIRRFESVLEARRVDGDTESWLEREFLALLRRAGLEVPSSQVRIEQDGAFVARVDFLYVDRRLVIEVGGYRHHSTRRQTTSDAARRSELLLAGYRVLELTYDDVVQRPEWVVDLVRRALHQVQAA